MKEFENEKIESIDLVFENCEVMQIPMESIPYFAVGNISENISLCGWSSKDCLQNKLRHTFTCGTFFLQTYTEIFDKLTDWAQDSNDTWHNRMDCDIVCVVINFENGENLNVYLPWPTDNLYDCPQRASEYQTWTFNKNGYFGFFSSYNKHDVIEKCAEWEVENEI